MQSESGPADAAHLQPLVVLVGPTGVGKTELAIVLAERLEGEIVSADSRLFYRGMDIGTAKPTPEERAHVPHHLIDIAEPDEPLSLAIFQRRAHDAVNDIHARRKLPFLVGGTGQYIRAVTEGWKPAQVQPDARLRGELSRLAEAKGAKWLYAKLMGLDPPAAARIDARNVRRTIRALEVILTSGRRFSEQQGKTTSPYHVIHIGLIRPRAELYERVDRRIEAMFAAGLEQEVRGLLEKGYSPDLPAMSAIGYRECVRLIRGEIDEQQARAEIRRATRMFVRRQANWFKESDPSIKWFVAREGVQRDIEFHLRGVLPIPHADV